MPVIINKPIYQNSLNMPTVPLMANDELTVTANGVIFAGGNASHGVVATGANTTMNINGDIFSASGSAIVSTEGGHDITISANGSAYGATNAIYLEKSANTIINAGEITGIDGAGISLLGTATPSTIPEPFAAASTARCMSMETPRR
jgi:hypothetical protein